MAMSGKQQFFSCVVRCGGGYIQVRWCSIIQGARCPNSTTKAVRLHDANRSQSHPKAVDLCVAMMKCKVRATMGRDPLEEHFRALKKMPKSVELLGGLPLLSWDLLLCFWDMPVFYVA